MTNLKKSLSIGSMVLVLSLSSMTAFAADTTTGAAGTLVDKDYSLEEMLVYAIEDEYLAQAEYAGIMDLYGAQKPFSNIIKAEEKHISLLLPLFETYGVNIPQKSWEDMVVVPESLEASYAIGVTAEVKNIAMYESFLKEDLPEDVKVIFDKLMTASESHLKAFQNAVEGKTLKGTQGKGNAKNSKQGNEKLSGGNRNSRR